MQDRVECTIQEAGLPIHGQLHRLAQAIDARNGIVHQRHAACQLVQCAEVRHGTVPESAPHHVAR